MKIPRILRGVLGTAASWAVAWTVLTLAIFGGAALFGADLPAWQFWPQILMGAARRGAISGAAFAGVLALIGRRRSFGALRFPELMLSGALGAVVAPLITIGALTLGTSIAIPPTAIAVSVALSSVFGAVTAGSALYVARRAPELGAGDPPGSERTLTPSSA